MRAGTFFKECSRLSFYQDKKYINEKIDFIGSCSGAGCIGNGC